MTRKSTQGAILSGGDFYSNPFYRHIYVKLILTTILLNHYSQLQKHCLENLASWGKAVPIQHKELQQLELSLLVRFKQESSTTRADPQGLSQRIPTDNIRHWYTDQYTTVYPAIHFVNNILKTLKMFRNLGRETIVRRLLWVMNIIFNEVVCKEG